MSTVFGVASAMLTVAYIILVPLPNWVGIEGEKDVGVYSSVNHGSTTLYQTKCDENMSATECGFLHALQITTVLTILFGFFATLIYFVPPRSLKALPLFLATSGNITQFIFALITLVLFKYFQTQYFDDDGVNQEYPQPDTAVLTTVYWIWLAITVVLGVLVIASYTAIYGSRHAYGFLSSEDK
jgi:hypothetical protein